MLTGLVFRLIKGTPLTAAEGDKNLRILRDGVNALEQLLFTVLNPNGTLKSGAVATTDVLADGVVTAAKLAADAKFPAGAVVPFAGSVVPSGWFLCDGQSVSRTTYAALFTAIGVTYGIGDGATTFNVPDLRGRSTLGAGTGAGLTGRTLGDKLGEEQHILTAAEIPAHTHSVSAWTKVIPDSDPVAHDNHRIPDGDGADPGVPITGVVTDAAGGLTPPGGGAHNNIPPIVVLNYVIRS